MRQQDRAITEEGTGRRLVLRLGYTRLEIDADGSISGLRIICEEGLEGWSEYDTPLQHPAFYTKLPWGHFLGTATIGHSMLFLTH